MRKKDTNCTLVVYEIFNTDQGAQFTGNAFIKVLGSVDISTFEALRPAASPRDPGILLNAQACCTEIARTRSRGQAAGRRIRAIIDQNMKCQQTLASPQRCHI